MLINFFREHLPSIGPVYDTDAYNFGSSVIRDVNTTIGVHVGVSIKVVDYDKDSENDPIGHFDFSHKINAIGAFQYEKQQGIRGAVMTVKFTTLLGLRNS